MVLYTIIFAMNILSFFFPTVKYLYNLLSIVLKHLILLLLSLDPFFSLTMEYGPCLFVFIFKNIYIYLAAQGIHSGIWDLSVVACGV